MFGLEKFKDIFGKPGEGAHRLREPFFGTALIDWLGTLLLAYSLKKMGIGYGLITNTALLFVIAQVLHYIFGVQTTFIKFIKNLLKPTNTPNSTRQINTTQHQQHQQHNQFHQLCKPRVERMNGYHC